MLWAFLVVWSLIKNPPANTGDMGLIPGQRPKIPSCHRATKPHAAQLLSLRCRAQEAQLLTPVFPGAHVLQQEEPPQWAAHAPKLE